MIENIALSAKCRKSSFAVIDNAGRQLQNWGRSLTGKQLFCKQLIEGSIPSASIRPARAAFSEVNTALRRFFMRFICRGNSELLCSSGRQVKAKDISNYFANSGSNVLSDNSITGRIPRRFQSAGSDIKKGASVCKSRVLHTILARLARSKFLNLSLYSHG